MALETVSRLKYDDETVFRFEYDPDQLQPTDAEILANGLEEHAEKLRQLDD